MKKTLLTFLALGSSFLAFSQGTWTSRDTLPDSAMFQGITGFSIGNYGYAGLGEYNHTIPNFDELWRFDPSTNTWAKKASFPGGARVAPASFVIGDKAYIVTGSLHNGGACVTECWAYNSINNTWTQKANFPGAPRTYAVGFAIDSLGYVGTGADELSDFYKDFYAYHPSTNTWTRIADFGGIARDGDCGFAVNGKGYVCFGQDSTLKVHNDIWEYNPTTNTWTQKIDNPYPMLVGSGFVICNNIYVGSGDSTDGIDEYHGFWKYNTVVDSWTQEASVPGITKLQGTAFAIGDTGYYGFGYDSDAIVYNRFYRFYNNDSCNKITGYNNITDNSEINIYPNPNNGRFTLESNSASISGKNTLEVYNILGTKVFTEALPSTQGDNTINISNQPAGIYLYRILNNNGVLIGRGKVIIQK
jgi:N-acetylneuraminic acid mutarotase